MDQNERDLAEDLLLLARLAAHRAIDGECWNWTAARTAAGYGQLWVDGKARYVHRLIAVIELGLDESSGQCVRHDCDNPACHNPEHLALGTHADNMRDAVLRGRMAKKLTPDKVGEIKAKLQTETSRADLASEYGVSRKTIDQIAKGETWAHVLPRQDEHLDTTDLEEAA